MRLANFRKPALFQLFFGVWALDLLINVINNGRDAWVPIIPLDARIPFIPFFIFFYSFYFPLVVAPLFILYRAREHLESYVRSSLLVMLISYAIFLTIPTRLNRIVIEAGSAAGGLTLLYHKLVAPYNLLPSLHVSMLLVAQFALSRYNGKLALCYLPFVLLCIASVVFTKQHYILDVFTALPLGVIGFAYGYRKRNQQPD